MKSRRKQESHNSTLSDILSKNKLSDEIVLYIVQLPENAELLKSFQPNNNFGLEEILKILESLNIDNPLAYAARHKNEEELRYSRSGAVFVAMSDYILEHGKYGYLCSSDLELYNSLIQKKLRGKIEEAKSRICNQYTWNESAKEFFKVWRN